MAHAIKPITITPEQIIAAAQRIVNKDETAWESTPEEYLAAVRNYLECCISDILSDADWHANNDNFTVGKKYFPSFVEEANELGLPEPPEWAHEELSPST